MLAPELNDRLILTYSTPLYREQLDDLAAHSQALADLAMTLRAEDAGIQKSNQGGWHSPGNVFARSEPALAELGNRIRTAIRYLCGVCGQGQQGDGDWGASLFGWLNVNAAGDYMQPHHHSGNTWSGVYYIQTGPQGPERPMSGRIEFLDPRVRCDVGPTQSFSHTGTLAITPRDGLMLIFPSYLQHFVHPYHGDQPRITLAFNSLVQRTPSAAT